MAINRSGIPTGANSTSAITSLGITVPTGAAVGALGFIAAFSTATGAWPAAPNGWSAVPGTTQTTSADSCIVYAKILTATDAGATVTVNANSGELALCCFAYTGAQVTDANAARRNASSTTCTAPAVSPVGSADMLVMIGGAAFTTTRTFSAPILGGTGEAIWFAANSVGLADLQLSAAGSTGTSTMTINTATVNAGIQLTLMQLDGDGEASTSTGARRSALRPWNRATQLAALGGNEQLFDTPITDDGWTAPTPRFEPLGGRLRRRTVREDEQLLVEAPSASPLSRPTVFRTRLRRAAEPLSVSAADRPVTLLDEASPARPIRRWDRVWRRLRQIAEDLGLAISTAPSFGFAATLDLSIHFAAATLDQSLAHVAATLDRSIIFATATVNSTVMFTATLNPPLIFGATLG